jgi:hypothetical protein
LGNNGFKIFHCASVNSIISLPEGEDEERHRTPDD